MPSAASYQIRPNTPTQAKRIDSAWTGASIDPHTTTKVSTFADQDVLLDPRSVYAPVEDCPTARIKARWMECGYYGFGAGSWLMLVSQELVIGSFT